jgi:hypothetical protein
MKSFRKFKSAMLLVLICVAVAGSLSACLVEEGRGGHERFWR